MLCVNKRASAIRAYTICMYISVYFQTNKYKLTISSLNTQDSSKIVTVFEADVYTRACACINFNFFPLLCTWTSFSRWRRNKKSEGRRERKKKGMTKWSFFPTEKVETRFSNNETRGKMRNIDNLRIVAAREITNNLHGSFTFMRKNYICINAV